MPSLKRLLSLTVAITGALLVIVLVLALSQQRITTGYGEVLAKGGTIVFRFNSLRDHLINAMLEKKWESFRQAGDELEAINRELLTLLDHPYVPAGYKVSLADRVDIQRIALLAREIASDSDREKKSVQLAQALREMADQLIRLDRVLIGQMNERLIQFQKMAIGALTLICGMIGFLLTVLYRRGFSPLLSLVERLREGEDMQAIDAPRGSCVEFRQLVELIKKKSRSHPPSLKARRLFRARTINAVSNLLNGIINYAQILIDECQAREGSDAHRTMLRKIVTHSEEIARLVQPEEADRAESLTETGQEAALQAN